MVGRGNMEHSYLSPPPRRISCNSASMLVLILYIQTLHWKSKLPLIGGSQVRKSSRRTIYPLPLPPFLSHKTAESFLMHKQCKQPSYAHACHCEKQICLLKGPFIELCNVERVLVWMGLLLSTPTPPPGPLLLKQQPVVVGYKNPSEQWQRQ